MRLGVNANFQLSGYMSFDNGWAININEAPCGHHVTVTIVPTYLMEHSEIRQHTITANPAYWENKTMEARGDYYPHFKGSDDELLDIIVGVASREQEPYLRKISQDIMKAVKA